MTVRANLKQIYRKYLGSPLIAVAIAFFILAGVTLLISKDSPKTLGVITQNKKIEVTKKPTPTSKNQADTAITEGPLKSTKTINITPTPYKTETKTTTTTTTTSGSGNSSAGQQQNKVKLSINSSSAGEVNVSPGQNQCDVLSNALGQGKISSLNMRWEGTLGTYGVYQINGIGKDNAVWWVYKINGTSPNQGCSYIKANNGDSVEWKYIGN